MSEKEVNLGHESTFTTYPTEVKVNNETYFLVQNDSKYQLLSTICPHAGGTVMNFGDSLVCPIHYWSFDKSTGACNTFPSLCLDTIDVSLRDGFLIAEIA